MTLQMKLSRESLKRMISQDQKRLLEVIVAEDEEGVNFWLVWRKGEKKDASCFFVRARTISFGEFCLQTRKRFRLNNMRRSRKMEFMLTIELKVVPPAQSGFSVLNVWECFVCHSGLFWSKKCQGCVILRIVMPLNITTYRICKDQMVSKIISYGVAFECMSGIPSPLPTLMLIFPTGNTTWHVYIKHWDYVFRGINSRTITINTCLGWSFEHDSLSQQQDWHSDVLPHTASYFFIPPDFFSYLLLVFCSLFTNSCFKMNSYKKKKFGYVNICYVERLALP